MSDGGPAYPASDYAFREGDLNDKQIMRLKSLRGMSLRDHFAGQGLIALFAAANHPQHCGIARKDYGDAASGAYELADAMLKAREHRK